MHHPTAHTHLALPAGWECALDQASGHWYYFNKSTGATSWVPPQPDTGAIHGSVAPAIAPEGRHLQHVAPATSAAVTPSQGAAHTAAAPSVGAVAAVSSAAPAAAPAAAGHPSSSVEPSGGSGNGWYYRDRSGKLQGPFQQDHLRAWRAFLPMDLMVWYVELQPPQQQKQQKQQQAAAQAAESRPADASAGAKEAPVAEEGRNAAGNGPGDEAPRAADTGAEPVQGGLDGEVDGPPEVTAEVARSSAEAAEGPVRDDSILGAGRQGSDGCNGGGVEASAEDSAEAEPPAAKRVRTEGEAPSGLERKYCMSPSPAPGPDQAGEDVQSDDNADIVANDDEPTGRLGRGGFRTAEEAIAVGLPAIELAELVGDGQLLADWRQRFPGHRPPGTAPPATVHDHWLRAAAAAAAAAHSYGHAHGHHGPQYGQGRPGESAGAAGGGDAASRPRSREESMLEYAEAVLAGLPPDDEAVILARHAAAAGKSLAEVVNFSWAASASGSASGSSALQYESYDAGGAGGPTVAAVDEHGAATEYVRDPRSGRLTAVGREAPPASTARTLYGEYGSWVNPEQIEDYLAKAKQWRREQLPALWARKKLKEQREAKAKKAAKALAL